MATQKAQRRARRVADLVQQEIARLLQFEVKDPRVGMVTVTGVEVTDDLSMARVYWSILGDDSDAARKRTAQGLRAAAGFLRSNLGVLGLRQVPELHFLHDRSGARAAHLNALLDSLRAPTPAVAAAPDEDGDDER